MSILKVNKLTGIVEAPHGIKAGGGSITVNFTVDSIGGLPDSSTAQVGDWFWDSGNETLKYYIGPGHNDSDGWINIGLTDSAGAAGPAAFYITNNTTLYVSGGAYSTTDYQYIDVLSIDATSASLLPHSDYTLSAVQNSHGTTGDGTRILTMGGYTNGYVSSSAITYFSTPITSNATSFGNIISAVWHTYGCAASNGTYALLTGNAATTDNTIQYVTIQTTGNSTDFGDLTLSRSDHASTSTKDRTFIHSGYDLADIEYVTPTVPGNAADLGVDLAQAGRDKAAFTDGVYVFYTAGKSVTSGTLTQIDYFSVASMTGTAGDFGDLTQGGDYGEMDGHGTRAVASFYYSGYSTTQQDIYSTATPGNATNVGSLSPQRYGAGACAGQ